MCALQKRHSQEHELVKNALQSIAGIPHVKSSEAVPHVTPPTPQQRVVVQLFYWLLFGTLVIRRCANTQAGSREEASQNKSIVFWPAAWTIFKQGFEILRLRTVGRPTYLFRSFRVVAKGDPIWTACAAGDLEQVQELCASGVATPFDVDHGGYGLLHVSPTLVVMMLILTLLKAAAMYHQAALCKWLIQAGVNCDSRGIDVQLRYTDL
jgi:hypothetical protein